MRFVIQWLNNTLALINTNIFLSIPKVKDTRTALSSVLIRLAIDALSLKQQARITTIL